MILAGPRPVKRESPGPLRLQWTRLEEEHEGTLCEVVRTQSAALRIYVKETVSRFVLLTLVNEKSILLVIIELLS